MGLKASKGNDKSQFGEQPQMEAGNYPVRLVQVIDFGLQAQKPYKGTEKATAHIVGLTYEFVDCFMVDKEGKEIEDKPRWISEQIPLYSLNADKAKSTNRINALDANNEHDGDLVAMLGAPANATIVLNKSGDKVYENIASLAPMRPRDAQKCPELKNPTKFFDLTEPNAEVFNSLPKWIQDKIKENLNYAGSKLQKLLGGEEAPKNAKEDKTPEPESQNADEDQDTPW